MEKMFYQLINAISSMNGIHSIGKTGAKELPISKESDIDVYIFCDEIPKSDLRRNIYHNINYNIKLTVGDFEDRHWGMLDYLCVDEIDICLMYFDSHKVITEIDSLLKGDRLVKEDNYFYPIGQCATLKDIFVLLY